MPNNKLFRFCPNCGHPVKPGIRFCPNCGHDLASNHNSTQSHNYRPNRSVSMLSYPHQYQPPHKLGISIAAIVVLIMLICGGGYIYHEHDINAYLSNNQNNNTQSSPNNSQNSNSSSSNSLDQHPELVKSTIKSYWNNVESIANQYGSASDNRSELKSYFVDGSNNSNCIDIAKWAANLTSNVKINSHIKSIHFDGKYADVTYQVDYDFYGGNNDRSQGFIWHGKMVPSNGSYKFINNNGDNSSIYNYKH